MNKQQANQHAALAAGLVALLENLSPRGNAEYQNVSGVKIADDRGGSGNWLVTLETVEGPDLQICVASAYSSGRNVAHEFRELADGAHQGAYDGWRAM